jgi:hypothetical protein
MARKRPKTSTDQFSVLALRALKQEMNRKADDLIETVLKPQHVQPPPLLLSRWRHLANVSVLRLAPWQRPHRRRRLDDLVLVRLGCGALVS